MCKLTRLSNGIIVYKAINTTTTTPPKRISLFKRVMRALVGGAK